MTEIINRQRKISIVPEDFQEFTQSAVDAVNRMKCKAVTVAFVSDKKIRELNKLFRGKKNPTDVLSFPYESDEYDLSDSINFLGDIVISAEQAARQAKENDLTLEIEIKQLILHGILHLCGYDHETDNGEMNSRELRLRDKLKIT